MALLAGDALLTHAFGTFASLGNRVNPAVFQEALQFFIQSVGAYGIMGGQALELELSHPTLAQVLEVQAQKTTALFQASILIPVLLAGYTRGTEVFQKHLQFSEAFGFAFQAADDLADQSQDEARKQNSKNLLSFITASELKKKAQRQLIDCELTSQSALAQWLLKQF